MNIIYSSPAVCAPAWRSRGSAQHGERSRGGPGTCWSHSQLHTVGGCQQLHRADNSPIALIVSKELQGSVPCPTVRRGLLSLTNTLEQPLGNN